MMEEGTSTVHQTGKDETASKKPGKETKSVREKLDRKNLLVYPEIMKPKFDDF